MAHDFKIGDRVYIYNTYSMYYNKTGTIINFLSHGEIVLIKFDEPFIDDDGINHASRYTGASSIKLLDSIKENKPKIRWYSKGRFSDWEEKE